jgi:hypothetical protein
MKGDHDFPLWPVFALFVLITGMFMLGGCDKSQEPMPENQPNADSETASPAPPAEDPQAD